MRPVAVKGVLRKGGVELFFYDQGRRPFETSSCDADDNDDLAAVVVVVSEEANDEGAAMLCLQLRPFQMSRIVLGLTPYFLASRLLLPRDVLRQSRKQASKVEQLKRAR